MKIRDLFYLENATPLELINMTSNNPAVNFVSRTGENNGVVGYVDLIDNIKPYKAGTITVALGGSVLSAFLQKKDYYTSFHIKILTPKKTMTDVEKLYYCYLITANKYRYSYGRQANKTLEDIEVPNELPSWVNNFSLEKYKKQITTKIKPNPVNLEVENWKEFRLVDFFDMTSGKFYYSDEYSMRSTPYVSASNSDNGIMQYINLNPDFKGNCLTIGKVGLTCFYQKNDFCATSDVTVLIPKYKFNPFIVLFLSTLLNKEGFKWNYGRQIRLGDCKELVLKLPTKDNITPNWEYMENICKSLPFSDKI